MLVSIQQKHIDNGIPGDYTCCAVALALEELLGEPVLVSEEGKITYSLGTITNPDGSWFILPLEVREWIEKFDSDDEVEPINFEIP